MDNFARSAAPTSIIPAERLRVAKLNHTSSTQLALSKSAKFRFKRTLLKTETGGANTPGALFT